MIYLCLGEETSRHFVSCYDADTLLCHLLCISNMLPTPTKATTETESEAADSSDSSSVTTSEARSRRLLLPDLKILLLGSKFPKLSTITIFFEKQSA